ncbi:MAG: hypothetical protein A2283_00090 [Lentisphaerae bacterium RIFOXYA12_FULL_48_11]|nr:MAG: hypothetical protein A2283_00090 [Lentisphaerae bacterium RIFOXYA12_FULL_48_11]
MRKNLSDWNKSLSFFTAVTVWLCLLHFLPAQDHALKLPEPREVVDYSVSGVERTWTKANTLPDNLGCRELFASALALCEAGIHPERLEKLFEIGARMQDRDKASRGYGNFRWYWWTEGVTDYNAVEFCMQSASLIWIKHRDRLPEKSRKILCEVLDYAVEGCMRHKVRDTYTNIALMNAANLILLGEALEMTAVADEGYRRFDGIVRRTLESGIYEYGSPTYYRVDLDDLLMLEAYCRRETGRKQASAMLEVFWTDIALNWFPGSERLGGPHSRDYDYLRAKGGLANHLWYNGWIQGKPEGGAESIYLVLARWRPSEKLFKINRTQFPRLVRQAWGPDQVQSRTHYVMQDVSMGSASANYHNMDMPLCVDFACDTDTPRCYFIPDCRNDPYGKIKVQEGKGPHSKTLHMRPFWAAAQRTTDAVGLVLYRKETMLDEATVLKSHFVMPRNADGFWIGEKKVEFKNKEQFAIPVNGGEPLFLRKGTAAVGVRVPWISGVGDKSAKIEFVDDANQNGAVRLTVTHYEGSEKVPDVKGAGAVFLVRIGGGLKTDTEFESWRKEFVTAPGSVSVANNMIRISAVGKDGNLKIETGYPVGTNTILEPLPSRVVIELDGKDIGGPILEKVVKVEGISQGTK